MNATNLRGSKEMLCKTALKKIYVKLYKAVFILALIQERLLIRVVVLACMAMLGAFLFLRFPSTLL